MALEFLLERFPVKQTLRDGTEVTIRPLERRDAARLHKFFTAIPEEERLSLAEKVTERAVVDRWCRTLDPDENFTLLMVSGAKVIAQATLHQRQGGWKRHIGVLTTFTHPDYRGRDAVKLLGEEILEIARHLGMHRLESELNGERTVAIRALESLGFKRLLQLPDYVMDMQTGKHDYLLLGIELMTDEEFAAAG